MLKKMLAVTAICMSFVSNTFATDLVTMGKVSLSHEAFSKQQANIQCFFDADTVKVDKANNLVYFNLVIKHPNGGTVMSNCTEYRAAWARLTNDPKNSETRPIVTRFVDDTTGKVTQWEGSTYGYSGADNLSAESNGPYHITNTIYREFAYFLNIPNQNGKPYVTPKSLGLTWIKSTDKFGVFYYPNSVKVKGNKVDVKAVYWYPSENRYQIMKATLDYDKQLYKPSSSDLRRINTGESVESASKGLIPGLTGPKFYTFKFSDAEEYKIISDFFRSKVKK